MKLLIITYLQMLAVALSKCRKKVTRGDSKEFLGMLPG
jgi:hypothetical protein